jgi:hypothetical protein
MPKDVSAAAATEVSAVRMAVSGTSTTFTVQVEDLGITVQGSEFKIQGSGFFRV